VIVELVEEAVGAGARRERACETVGICVRTVARWRVDGGGKDGRADGGVSPVHKLTEAEQAQIVAYATSPEYRDLSPRQIVPLLADEGIYVASESSFYRVLHEHGLMSHREPSRPRTHRRPPEHVASAPNLVWSWDITYLRSPVRGVFFYLYLVLDIFSRKVVAHEVNDAESAEIASDLMELAYESEEVVRDALVLHADNGGAMKGSTMLATLQRLGVVASFSRPSVSDDNPFAEAIFRTLKYRPGYPKKPFADLAAARAWVDGFVRWYNSEHLHSGIRFVHPIDRHEGRDKAILAARHGVYTKAKARTPRRWTGGTRNWTPVGAVRLNPEKRDVCSMH
jgi:transposase InsO family protein